MAEFTQGQVINAEVGIEMNGSIGGSIIGVFKVGDITKSIKFDVAATGSYILDFDNITLDLSPGTYTADVTITDAATGRSLGYASGSVIIKEAAVYKMALKILNIKVNDTQIYP